MNKALGDREKDILFREARTYNTWEDRDIDESILKELYDLTKMGPTAFNSCPARFVFVKSKEAKERLKPYMAGGNVDKTMSAPVTVLIAMDLKFYERLNELFPVADVRGMFEGNDEAAMGTASRNTSLQGAYLMMAARSLGLDCGPMSGFNMKGVEEEFFPEGNVKMDFICNLGYGTKDGLYDRLPRLAFDDAVEVL